MAPTPPGGVLGPMTNLIDGCTSPWTCGGTRGGYIDSFENMPGAQNQPFGATLEGVHPCDRVDRAHRPGPDAAWLGTDSVTGIVCDIVPGQLHEATTVVKLEEPVDGVGRTGRTVTGDYLVLEPAGPEPLAANRSAHVRAEPPSSEPWLEREAGVWVDDAASYEFD